MIGFLNVGKNIGGFVQYSMGRLIFALCFENQHAGVAELVDALDLGSSAARFGGSSPSTRTTGRKEDFDAGTEA